MSVHVSISANVLDNSQFSPSPPVPSTGVYALSSSDVNITGNVLSSYYQGLSIDHSADVSVTANTFTSNPRSASIVFSTSVTFDHNHLSEDPDGLWVIGSLGVTIGANAFDSGGVRISGDPFVFVHTLGYLLTYDITPDNLVNGKPIYFYKNCNGLDIDGAPVGQLIVVNCKQVRVSNLQISNTTAGMQLLFVNSTSISNNSLFMNGQGLTLSGKDLTVSGNNVFLNRESGVIVVERGYSSNGRGVDSDNVTISSNNFSWNRGFGVLLNSRCLDSCTSTILLFQNNFVNNNLASNLVNNAYAIRDGQVHALSPGHWDNGYPDGGNYWSDYLGRDECSGPGQNACPAPDGIGDTGYRNAVEDNYPLTARVITSDTSAPTWPAVSILTPSNIGTTSLTLTWTPSTDNVGVVGYRVYEGSDLIAIVTGDTTAYHVTGLFPGAGYTFMILAGDPSDNWSSFGPSLTVATSSSASFLGEYWYLIAGGLAAATTVPFLIWRTSRKRSERHRNLSS